ncbi:hypothetical protein [Erysipelothrix rhusiopathiae]|nr:hypothetical protein [Erysipelothrix rhusiopathiae]VEH83481.1 Uncharacterised protein [Erysipelothrix rhusiopathiae]
MIENQRAVIAFIVYKLVRGINHSSVYSFTLSDHINVSGKISEARINVYDNSRGCHISGSSSSENKYSLYDFGSGYHFSGDVRNNLISLYDYETNEHYNYSI